MVLLLQYTLIFASVLILVALGGCFAEHSGVINLGLEGIMIMGALGGAQDVIEMMMAGAKAVQVGAANLVDPYACKKIIDDLPREMERLGIERLSDIQRV